MIKKIFSGVLQYFTGVFLGLLILELALNLNTQLLLRGMSLPDPIDPPLIHRQYDIYHSDQDLFFWQHDLMRPVDPLTDALESRVNFITDEHGFRNTPPQPPDVDLVVLGRSHSIAAKLDKPWATWLADYSGLRVLNLAQPGSDIVIKLSLLKRYGFPHKPDWVILEVLPHKDVVILKSVPKLITQQLASPLFRQLSLNYLQVEQPPPATPVFPITLQIGKIQENLSFFRYYLDTLTADIETLESSIQWVFFTSALHRLVAAANANGICVMILYAPTKPEIYFPIASDPSQLVQLGAIIHPIGLDENNSLGSVTSATKTGYGKLIQQMIINADAGRVLLGDLADQMGLPFVDPTMSMRSAALAGNQPFLAYDTHWSETGSMIVAQTVLEALSRASCNLP